MRHSVIRGIAIASALLAPLCSLAGPVNVNEADAATLSAELRGVGMSKAQAIVEYREAHGPFETVDELVEVKGIGERTIEINRANILLAPAGGADKQ